MKISMLTAAFDVEPWVASAIASHSGRTPPDEVIVVDDGSRGAMAEVASSYPTVRLLRQENRGLAAARNAGAAKSTGTPSFSSMPMTPFCLGLSLRYPAQLPLPASGGP